MDGIARGRGGGPRSGRGRPGSSQPGRKQPGRPQPGGEQPDADRAHHDEDAVSGWDLSAPATRVVVVGGGVSGLVAARECARPGFDVTLVEASDHLGGCVASHEVAGIRLDAGAESFATRGGHVASLIEDLGLADRVATPDPEGAWVRAGNESVPLPKAGLLGIPSSPLATDVIRAIGWAGALRAYLDRLMPVLKIGQEHNLGELVRRRMGRRVLERLVAPVATGVYSAAPEQLDLAVVAPGLNQAITQTGSLSGAVGLLRSSSKAGSAVGGLVAGMSTLVDALEADVRRRGGRIITGVGAARIEAPSDAEMAQPGAPDPSPVQGADSARPLGADPSVSSASLPVSPAGPSAPSAGLDAPPAGPDALSTPPTGPDASPADPSASPAGPDASPAPRWSVVLADGTALDADAVIVAAPGPAALKLVASAGPALAALSDLDWPDASSVELATLVVDLPELDAHPRGTGMLVADGAAGVEAKALTHSTAKWAWLAEAAGPGRHVVRLSYGRAGRESATASLDDGAFRELARRDASELLGIPIPESRVVGFDRQRWTNALPFAAVGQRERIRLVRDAVAGVEGVEITGAWLTGTGLASVVPGAKEAARAARGLRWRELTGNH